MDRTTVPLYAATAFPFVDRAGIEARCALHLFVHVYPLEVRGSAWLLSSQLAPWTLKECIDFVALGDMCLDRCGEDVNAVGAAAIDDLHLWARNNNDW